MTTLTPTPLLKAAALVFALVLAPAAQAQSRDTGVGLIIAAQGNQALAVIRAEIRESLKLLKPALPAAPQPLAAAYGAGQSVTPTQRGAK